MKIYVFQPFSAIGASSLSRMEEAFERIYNSKTSRHNQKPTYLSPRNDHQEDVRIMLMHSPKNLMSAIVFRKAEGKICLNRSNAKTLTQVIEENSSLLESILRPRSIPYRLIVLGESRTQPGVAMVAGECHIRIRGCNKQTRLCYDRLQVMAISDEKVLIEMREEFGTPVCVCLI